MGMHSNDRILKAFEAWKEIQNLLKRNNADHQELLTRRKSVETYLAGLGWTRLNGKWHNDTIIATSRKP